MNFKATLLHLPELYLVEAVQSMQEKNVKMLKDLNKTLSGDVTGKEMVKKLNPFLIKCSSQVHFLTI